MRTVQRSLNAGEVTPAIYGRTDLEKWESAAALLLNFVVMPHGGATRRQGTEFVAEVKNHNAAARVIPFVFSATQAYELELGEDSSGNGYLRFYMNGGQIQSGGSPYELVNGGGGVVIPWVAADLDEIEYFQSADKLWLTHPDWDTQEITRTGHTAWTIESYSVGTSTSTPASPSASSQGTTGATTYQYKVTAVAASSYEESLPTAVFGVSDGNATLSAADYVALSWTAVAGATHYNIYKNYAGTYGYLGRSETNSFDDHGDFTANINEAVPTDNDPFSGVNDKPRAGCFHKQRISFGGSDNNPQTINMSQTGNFWNFNKSFPLRDDDACAFTLDANQVNVIRWMVSVKNLIVGTAGGEWSLKPGASGYGITPTSVDANQESAWGSDPIQPAVAGNAVLFVQRGGRRLRELIYSWESDGYASADLSVLAEHLTRTYRITQVAWQQAPHQVLWCVRSDGILLGLTYMREHKVLAWHHHEIGGDGIVESVSCIPQADGGEDELWMVVRRTIDGSTVRYIERMSSSFISDDVEDATFIDSFLTYSGAAATTITGLDHLEGATVSILADGSVMAPRVVSGGSITLDFAAELVHVGLGYDSDLETLPLSYETKSGPTIGRQCRIKNVVLRLYRSQGLLVGPDEDHLYDVPWRSSGDELGEALPLFSGLTDRIDVDAETSMEQSLLIRQDQPLPCTILAIIPDMEAY